MPELWKNIKNSTLYEKLYECIDCTNAREGTLMIAYRMADMLHSQVWVRDKEEFLKKFVKVEGEMQ